MDTPENIATTAFQAGYSCSQSVLSAFSERCGLEFALAKKISAPFGAGISRQGQICGAVSGALMVIGLQEWDENDEIRPNKERVYQRSQEFMQRFTAMHGSVICSQLVQLDWNDADQVALARQDGRFDTFCPLLVSDAVSLVEEFLFASKAKK